MRGVLVTGASGAVGSIIVRAADRAGAPSRGLARSDDDGGWQESVRHARAELGGDLVVVHSAIPPQPRSATVMARYERASVELFDLAAALGIGLVLVSTLSIHPGNPSAYVAHKLEAEALAQRRGAGVVRLGLVRVEGPDSAFTRIRELVRRAPLGFVTTPESVYYVTTTEDLESWAMALADGSGPLAGVQACADPRPMTLTEAVELPAEGRIRRVGPWAGRVRPPRLPGALGAALDPVINLRAGMGWVDGA